MTKVLMVCMGNICRSPMAEAIARKMAADAGMATMLTFSSAGTHANHVGERLDPRAVTALSRRGYDAGRVRSRKLALADFQRFDVILAMDNSNMAELLRICPSEHTRKIGFFLAGTNGQPPIEVPDPYYGNQHGFERVMDLCELGARALIERLK
jgi:protein-tyrosine phosphatase